MSSGILLWDAEKKEKHLLSQVLDGGHILVKFELKTDSISCRVKVSVPSL